MATGSQVTRITSKDIHIEATPIGSEADECVFTLYFTADSADAIAGTFRLWVDGKLTAPITYAVVATMATSVAAALNAADVLGVGAVSAADSATDPGNVEITFLAVGYHAMKGITIEDDGDSTLNASLRVHVNTQGTETFRIDAEASAFNFEESVDLVDMTAISEFNTTEVAVKASASFELNLFEAQQDWSHVFYGGANIIFMVWETGKVPGSKYFAMQGVIDSYSKDFPDHEKVEIAISGTRVGAMLIPFNTVYRV